MSFVHERDRKRSRETTQEVEIYFNFVGRFVPPKFAEVELTPEEIEERRKQEERKDRLHQNYLKRKASGKHQAYENKIKDKRKADIDAKKAAIRAEDMAKGVFIPFASSPHKSRRKESRPHEKNHRQQPQPCKEAALYRALRVFAQGVP